MKIEGNRINLRSIKKSDAETLTELLQDKEISEFTFIPYPYKLKDAYEFIEFANKENNKNAGLHLSIEDKQTGQIIGGIGLNAINENHRWGEIGYWLAKKMWGQGIVSQALALMVPYCMDKYDLVRIHAYVRPENPASIKVLEKAGFTQEGLLRKYHFQNNQHHDFYIFSILSDEA